MPRMAIRPMSVGEVLDRSFQMLRHHFPTLFLTALIGAVPLLLLFLATGVSPLVPTQETEPGAAFFGIFIALMVLTMLLYGVVWAGLAAQVDDAVANRPISVSGGLKAGLKALPRLIGAGIVLYLVMFGIMVVIGIAAAIALPLLGFGDSFGMGMIIGAVLLTALVGWGVVVWTPLTFLMLPAVVLDRSGPIEAMRRSNRLAKGGRLRVITIAVVSWILVALPSIALPVLMGIGSSIWDPAVAGTLGTTQLFVYQVGTFLVSSVTTPFLVAAMVFTYYDRRARREGYDVQVPGGAPAVSPAMQG